jgi:pimeloyl-ACP methyl ester carboxylesterase
MQHILLLHGAIGSEEQLFSLRDLLSSSQYQVHSFNFPGHGGAAIKEPLSMELLAEETLGYIKKNELENLYVFGYSMGGYVAMYLSSLYPGVIRKIVTLGTKYNWSPEIAAKEIKMLCPEIIEEKVPAFAAALAKKHGQHEWKSLLTATADMLMQLGNKPLLDKDSLQKISAEALLLIGEKDNMVSLEETVAAAQLLEKGSALVLSDTPHPIEQVNIKMLAEKIVSFF